MVPSEQGSSFLPSKESVLQWSYRPLNVAAVAAVTTGTVLALESPITTIILNKTKSGNFIPQSTGKIGFFSIAAGLYKGVSAQLAGSGARAVYVTNAKQTVESAQSGHSGEVILETTTNSKPESKQTKRSSLVQEMGYVALFSAGDVSLSHPFDNKSSLDKMEILGKDFKWSGAHNAFKLSTMGLGSRYTTAVLNFTSLFLLENMLAKKITVKSPVTQHVLAGATSGALASVVTFPFNYYRDYALGKAHVIEGKLQSTGSKVILGELAKHVQKVGLGETIGEGLRLFKAQGFLRAGRAALVFAAVTGVSELLGHEPLAPYLKDRQEAQKGSHGFFSSNQPEHVSEKVVVENVLTTPKL